ncbi:MAG: phosphoribosylamine--glycine ligase [Bacteroidota bacterium]
MNILILGSGGREHALAWKIAQSPLCDQLFVAPGNAGTQALATNLAVDLADHEQIRGLVDAHEIELLLVGPEQPLVDGLTDALQDHPVKVVGPSQAAAQLEGSKDFSKRFMRDHGIPTARYRSFGADQLSDALDYLDGHPLPVVVKASGLAAGKGVLICEGKQEAKAALRGMLSGESFGQAGQTVVVEEFLQGIEISLFVLTDGKDYLMLPSAKDYKRIGEGDRGLNTGGMGAVSPVPFADEDFLAQAEAQIVQPTIAGIQAEGLDYRGFIFIGLMVVGDIAYVLEYNVRMGDPETEVVMPRLKSDLVPLLLACADGKLNTQSIELDPRTCATVMLVSGGYPGSYEKGKAMSGFAEAAETSLLFHAGTKTLNGQTVTNGGRVLAVSSFGASIGQAVSTSLSNAAKIKFEGRYFRRDIGQDLMS